MSEVPFLSPLFPIPNEPKRNHIRLPSATSLSSNEPPHSLIIPLPFLQLMRGSIRTGRPSVLSEGVALSCLHFPCGVPILASYWPALMPHVLRGTEIQADFFIQNETVCFFFLITPTCPLSNILLNFHAHRIYFLANRITFLGPFHIVLCRLFAFFFSLQNYICPS